jgi:hypothetical protein
MIDVPTTQDVAIVMGGGGDPFAEYEQARAMCAAAGRNASVFAGNDMIEFFPHDIDHAVTLHPEKLRLWLPRRRASGFNEPPKVWGHQNRYDVTNWTRDWSGSTGLFCTKIAREQGHVHIVLCGVHMTVEGDHFVRKIAWNAALGFQRGWNARIPELRPYVRSFGGWTQQQLGAPTVEWLRQDIIEAHGAKRRIGEQA